MTQKISAIIMAITVIVCLTYLSAKTSATTVFRFGQEIITTILIITIPVGDSISLPILQT